MFQPSNVRFGKILALLGLLFLLVGMIGTLAAGVN